MESFRPFVRYARKHEQRIPTAEVCAVDHRLFFCHGGSAVCEIQGENYPIVFVWVRIIRYCPAAILIFSEITIF